MANQKNNLHIIFLFSSSSFFLIHLIIKEEQKTKEKQNKTLNKHFLFCFVFKANNFC